MLWHIGNTTVRTPYRLREALRVLEGSNLNGNISGNAQENAFAKLLHNESIVDAPRIAQGENASDLGRKWRAALSQLGFITPQLTRKVNSGAVDPMLAPMVEGIKELSGRAYELTPNGYRLARAEIITAQQECFLRSLVSYRIPSPIESKYQSMPFSPLCFILQVIHGLRDKKVDNTLSFKEFALFIQTASPLDGIDNIINKIIEYREGREKAKGKIRVYDRNFYEEIANSINREIGTLDDYADLSFRYLKATGLFHTSGRGIAIAPARAQLALLFSQKLEQKSDDKEYLQALWLGGALPTDDIGASYLVVQDLIARLNARGLEIKLPSFIELSLADLENKRHELEEMLNQLYERDYGNNQVNCIDEIIAWMKIIPNRGSMKLPNGENISIPKGEGPAYLEWIIWRCFLAMGSLCNTPWEARRFQIDQDFLPVSCAPGGGPDMIFEFNDAIIVVEVTLTTSSRQEAAEGEPVRRHVAQYAEAHDKPVYGLFIAITIDSNTAHTFRSGDWYLRDDSKLSLDIVPITLENFHKFFVSGRGRLSQMPFLIRQLLIECRAKANQDAPQWKQSINSIVQKISTY